MHAGRGGLCHCVREAVSCEHAKTNRLPRPPLAARGGSALREFRDDWLAKHP